MENQKTRGGSREGAGRKPNSYKSKTLRIDVPEHRYEEIKFKVKDFINSILR